MHAARKHFIKWESLEKLRRALHDQIRTDILQLYKNDDVVFYERNLCDRWLGPGIVKGWKHKQVLVKHRGTFVRGHPCRLVPHPEKYQISSESESIIEPTTSPTGPKETSNISISKENNVKEELETPSDHVEQHQTVRDGPTKQNPISKTIELPKPGQTTTRQWKWFRMEKIECHKQDRQSHRQKQTFNECDWNKANNFG